MRVLLYADVDLSLPGGVETHIRELTRCLTANGHHVEIFGRPVPLPPFHMVGSVDPSRYDVIHHHGGRWPRELPVGPGHVRTFHFSVAGKMKVYIRMGRWRTLLNPGNYSALAEERASARRPGAFIAVSQSVRRDIERIHRVRSGRIQVIPNGVRFDVPREGRSAWRAKHGIPESAPVMLSIGRRDFVKGFDRLDRVLKRKGVAPAGMIWVTAGGAAPERSQGRLVTGSLGPQEVTEWIHAADLGVFPSYYEGNAIGLLEMLAGGLYTLAAPVGAATEVIQPGVNGELVEPSDGTWAAALATRLAKPPGRVHDGLSEAYRWEAVAARVEAVYASALAPMAASSPSARP